MTDLFDVINRATSTTGMGTAVLQADVASSKTRLQRGPEVNLYRRPIADTPSAVFDALVVPKFPDEALAAVRQIARALAHDIRIDSGEDSDTPWAIRVVVPTMDRGEWRAVSRAFYSAYARRVSPSARRHVVVHIDMADPVE
jgi:hypothetical protein